jgi:hypothetical protein
MKWLKEAQNGNGGSEFWKGRYDRIIQRARKVPVGVMDVIDIFDETCPKSAYKKAHYVLSRMEKTKRLKYVGGLSTGGKKRNLYSTREIRNLHHEWCVGQVLKAFDWPECHTGSEVDKDIRPDGELFFGDQMYFLELDTGTMKRSQVERRWKQYEDKEEPMLVVTLTESRLRDLLRWSAIGYFTTLEKLSEAPWGKIWATPEGEMKSIDIPVENSVENSTTDTEDL